MNFDGREVARAHVNRLHLENLLKVMCATITTFTRRNTFFKKCLLIIMMCLHWLMQEVQKLSSVEELERFLLEHGEQIVDTLGSEVDRIEQEIKVNLQCVSL